LIEIQSRGQKNRRISNENEVVELLRALPGATHELIDWVELSGRDQVSKVVAADVLVGMHGAGLTHIQYAHDEIVLVELHPMRVPKTKPKSCVIQRFSAGVKLKLAPQVSLWQAVVPLLLP
jgi:capsular polysaccharide biosynthesis protein